MTRLQFAGGMVCAVLSAVGANLPIANHARDQAVIESRQQRDADMDRVYSELIPKLDEVIELMKRHPQTVQQRQEQHIHVPLKGDGIDMQSLAERALKHNQERNDATAERD